MPRSSLVVFAYSRNSRGHATSPARCRLSAAVRRLAPGGMVTFTRVPTLLLSHAATARVTASARPAAASARRALQALRREAKRMLKQDRGGERIDVALPAARGATHLLHRAQRRYGGIALVHQRHGQSRSLLQLRRDLLRLDRARRVVAAIIQREPHHERRRLGRLRAPHDLRDWRTLARAAQNETGWR